MSCDGLFRCYEGQGSWRVATNKSLIPRPVWPNNVNAHWPRLPRVDTLPCILHVGNNSCGFTASPSSDSIQKVSLYVRLSQLFKVLTFIHLVRQSLSNTSNNGIDRFLHQCS